MRPTLIAGLKMLPDLRINCPDIELRQLITHIAIKELLAFCVTNAPAAIRVSLAWASGFNILG
jgi:hypothetical protein